MAAASNDSPDFLSVVCPSCETRITATIAFAGKEISCPACLTAVPVPLVQPQLDEPTESVAKPRRTKSAPPQPEPEPESETIPLSRPVSEAEDDQAASYGIGKTVERPMVTIEVFKTVPQVKRQRVETPPTSLFFSNVFSFPWSTAAAAERWCYLSAGFMLSGLSYSACIWFLREHDTRGWLGVSFFLMLMVWFTVWSLSYAASNALAIVQETASGNNRIVGWGEGSWRDWVFELVIVMWIFSIAGMIALMFAWPMHYLVGSISPLLACLLVVTFPAIWLSAMDAETMWLPFSMTIVRSFSRVTPTWAQFLVLSLCLLMAVVGVLLPLAVYQPWVAGFMAGPVLASAVFVYARLLGRLGWKIADEMSRPEPVRRSQQTTKKA